jgi:hypothetical protein
MIKSPKFPHGFALSAILHRLSKQNKPYFFRNMYNRFNEAMNSIELMHKKSKNNL